MKNDSRPSANPEWGPNRLALDRSGPRADLSDFRRAEVPEGIMMSCFEQMDETGKVIGKVWVQQKPEAIPAEQ